MIILRLPSNCIGMLHLINFELKIESRHISNNMLKLYINERTIEKPSQ
jgi:hypothetical protein